MSHHVVTKETDGFFSAALISKFITWFSPGNCEFEQLHNVLPCLQGETFNCLLTRRCLGFSSCSSWEFPCGRTELWLPLPTLTSKVAVSSLIFPLLNSVCISPQEDIHSNFREHKGYRCLSLMFLSVMFSWILNNEYSAYQDNLLYLLHLSLSPHVNCRDAY